MKTCSDVIERRHIDICTILQSSLSRHWLFFKSKKNSRKLHYSFFVEQFNVNNTFHLEKCFVWKSLNFAKLGLKENFLKDFFSRWLNISVHWNNCLFSDFLWHPFWLKLQSFPLTSSGINNVLLCTVLLSFLWPNFNLWTKIAVQWRQCDVGCKIFNASKQVWWWDPILGSDKWIRPNKLFRPENV